MLDGEAEAYGEGEMEAPEAKRDVAWLVANIDKPNLCDDLDDSELASMGAKVVEEFQIDCDSRKASGWEDRNAAALKLAMQVKEAKNWPWPNASNVKYPLITVAAIQFAARAYPAIVDGRNVAKGKVLGEPTPEKQERADRIGRHMSYQLLDQMEEWEEGTDQLLHILPITGNVFRKTYFDPSKGRNCSELILADKLVVNYWAKPLTVCPRVTQVSEYHPNEIQERFRSDLWRRIEVGPAAGGSNDDEAPHVFLEQHRLLDLDGDGYAEPYVVTVHKETQQVVRVYARYDESGIKANQRGEVICIEPVRYFTKYPFIPSLDGSFYDTGFGSLLLALNETINTTINQLMDAGTLQNVGGGFIGSGVSLKSGSLSLKMGEFRKVDVTGNIKDQVFELPRPMPSNVLFQLLGMLVEAAKDISATKDILTGETQQANQPVGTTLAMIEQGLKVFTGIYKRVHRALKQELACLYRLNSLYLDEQDYFTFQDAEGVVARQDYNTKDVDIVPVSDPTVVSDAQRIGRAQFLQQFRPDPLMNGAEINRRVLEAAGIPDVKALFAESEAPDPKAMAEMAKLDHDKERIALERQKLDNDTLRARLEIAEARAKNTETYANALATLAGIGKSTVKGMDGSTTTTDTPLSSGDMALMEDIHRLATGEIEGEEADGGQVHPGDVPAVEEPPADQAVPAVPEGPAGNAGPPMDDGQGDVAPAPDQGPPDGGALGPEVA